MQVRLKLTEKKEEVSAYSWKQWALQLKRDVASTCWMAGSKGTDTAGSPRPSPRWRRRKNQGDTARSVALWYYGYTPWGERKWEGSDDDHSNNNHNNNNSCSLPNTLPHCRTGSRGRCTRTAGSSLQTRLRPPDRTQVDTPSGATTALA